MASAVLASSIDADQFIIYTDVQKVCLNFNKEDEVQLDVLNAEQAKKYIEEGHFSEGSMLPKVEAAL